MPYWSSSSTTTAGSPLLPALLDRRIKALPPYPNTIKALPPYPTTIKAFSPYPTAVQALPPYPTAAENAPIPLLLLVCCLTSTDNLLLEPWVGVGVAPDTQVLLCA